MHVLRRQFRQDGQCRCSLLAVEHGVIAGRLDLGERKGFVLALEVPAADGVRLFGLRASPADAAGGPGGWLTFHVAIFMVRAGAVGVRWLCQRLAVEQHQRIARRMRWQPPDGRRHESARCGFLHVSGEEGRTQLGRVQALPGVAAGEQGGQAAQQAGVVFLGDEAAFLVARRVRRSPRHKGRRGRCGPQDLKMSCGRKPMPLPKLLSW